MDADPLPAPAEDAAEAANPVEEETVAGAEASPAEEEPASEAADDQAGAAEEAEVAEGAADGVADEALGGAADDRDGEPATEEPAAEEPATEEPAAEEPAAKEPAAEEPAAEEPAAEEAEAVEQAAQLLADEAAVVGAAEEAAAAAPSASEAAEAAVETVAPPPSAADIAEQRALLSTDAAEGDVAVASEDEPRPAEDSAAASSPLREVSLSEDAAAARLQARQRGNSLRRGGKPAPQRNSPLLYEEEDDGEALGESAPHLPLVPIRDDLQPVLADLHDQAARVVELMREWDEDNNGTTDASEFRVALPVLDLSLPRRDADEVFGWLLGEHHRQLKNAASVARHAYRVAKRKWIEAKKAAAEGGEEALSHLDPRPQTAPVPESIKAPTQIEHWALFRLLAGFVPPPDGAGGEEGEEPEAVDVDAAEAAARAVLAARETKHATDGESGASDFWTREQDGKARNRHALRKRKGAIKGWNRTADSTWQDSLTRGTKQAETLDDDDAEMGSRVLQGVVLAGTASTEDQLRFALRQNLTRVNELFQAWDEDQDGKVSKREFRRAVKLLGLSASKEDVDGLFDSFDPDGSGTIEFKEINAMLRTREEKKPLPVVPKLLGNTSKWGASVARVVVGNRMDAEKDSVARLREALKKNASSVIKLFAQWDVDGDGKITRAEFTRALPRMRLGDERFEASDADELFTTLDKDCSGSINYHELNAELRSNGRHAQTPEQIKMASKLLRRTDVVVVLGAPTKTKQAFCSRLAYTFRGTWLSCQMLAEREATAYGSRVAGDIRRRLEAKKPIPTSLLRPCVHAAVFGRKDNGPLPPLPGPFFLYDMPRSLRELQAIESACGKRAVLFMHFGQANFERETSYSDPSAEAVLAEVLEREAAEKGVYLSLDGEDPVRLIVDAVVRHLRVHGTQRTIQATEARIAQEKRQREIAGRQRDYLRAASTCMVSALRQTGAQAQRVETGRTQLHRRVYLEPTGIVEKKVAAVRERQRQAHEQLLEYLGPHFYEEQEQLRVSSPYFGGHGGHDELGASLGGGVDGGASACHGHGSATALPRFTSTAPAKDGLPKPSLVPPIPSAAGSAIPRRGGRSAAMTALLSPRYDPFAQRGFQPRTDLQLSPRNWREKATAGVPTISLPSVRGVYEHREPFQG